jgi:hypothetical protein
MADDNAPAPAGGDSAFLSVDAAAGLLAGPADAPPRPDQAAAGDDAGAASEDPRGDQADPADPPAEAGEGAQDPDADPALELLEEEGEGEPEAAPAIEPPTSWDADAKALFAQLPPELQTKVAEIQGQRDREVGQALERAAQSARRHDAEFQAISQFKAQIEQLLPQAQSTFASKWANVDWAAWAQQDPVAAYQAEKEYQAELGQLQRLQQAQQEAGRQQYARFLEDEGAKLVKAVPDLADPQKGPERRQQLQSFLVQSGIPEQDIAGANAAQLALAYDAYRYRQLQAQAKARLSGKGRLPTPPARPGVRPTPPAPGNSRTREAQQLSHRLAQTGKVDDAVALLVARGGQG